MTQLKQLFLSLFLVLNCCFASCQDTSAFKLFEKSTNLSGFGGLTFNLLDGDYFLIGGEGAGVFGNYYFGGFGFGGNIGTYVNPLNLNDYKLERNSGGILVGATSNTSQIFALFADLRLSFDHYMASSVIEDAYLPNLEYRNVSLIPVLGVTFRPINFLQISVGAGYNYSGAIDDGELENVPYRAPVFDVHLTFGRF